MGEPEAVPSFPSFGSFSRGSEDGSGFKKRSILIQEGRPRRQETGQSIHFDTKPQTILVPEPAEEELPEFCDEEEKERAVASAMKLAEAALSEEEESANTGESLLSCLNCCDGRPEEPAAPIELVGEALELSEETVERLSSRQLNKLVDKKVTAELSRGPSIIREDSFRVDKGIVSFSSFLVAKPLTQRCEDPMEPVPLTEYLPPSPLFTFDGKLGVECMAFKIDFTDRLKNIVPPFFLRDGEEADQRAVDILKKGVTYAQAIEMFGPEDLDFLKDEPSQAHKDLLGC